MVKQMNATGIFAPYDAMVYQDGAGVYAIDRSGAPIYSGTFNTNDAACIQAALDHLGYAGTLFIAEGNYRITTTLTAPRTSHHGLYIKGEGDGAWYKYTTGTRLQHRVDGDLMQIYGTGGDEDLMLHRTIVEDIKFWEDNNDSYTGCGLLAKAHSNLDIRRCSFTYFRQAAGLDIDTSWCTNLDHVNFYNCGSVANTKGALYIHSSLSLHNTALTMLGCNLSSNYYRGIDIRDCDPFYIEGNYIEGSTSDCQIYAGDNRGTIIGNYIGDLGASATGIYVGAYCNVTGNTFYGSHGAYGIYAASYGNSIIGNIVQHTQGIGIYAAAQNVVTGNNVHGCLTTGIELGSGCVASGNRCQDNGVNGILIRASATGCSVTGNTCINVDTSDQDYGIKEDTGCNYNVIVGNNCHTNASDGIVTVGANTVEAHNLE